MYGVLMCTDYFVTNVRNKAFNSIQFKQTIRLQLAMLQQCSLTEPANLGKVCQLQPKQSIMLLILVSTSHQCPYNMVGPIAYVW